MDQSLKNRLVGVVVLLALAVIVLPLLFDGANEQALLATRMPAPPAVPEAAALLAEPEPQLAEAEDEMTRDHMPAEPEQGVVPPVAVAPTGYVPAGAGGAAMPAEAAVPAVPVVKPEPEARLEALAEAWDVQVAAVSAAEGAERLKAKLLKAGYKARVYPAKGMFKVVVGPELRRQDADTLRARLAADARVGKPKGLLVRYVP